jgi:hypothetical protein
MGSEEALPFARRNLGVDVDFGRVLAQPADIDIGLLVEARDQLIDLLDLFFLAQWMSPANLNFWKRIRSFRLINIARRCETAAMSGLRERNKAKRREGILDAALELFGTAEIQSVNLDQIAARAEVSLPTIYNLVGTREQLLVALIGRVIEGLVETLSEKASEDDTDPIA